MQVRRKKRNVFKSFRVTVHRTLFKTRAGKPSRLQQEVVFRSRACVVVATCRAGGCCYLSRTHQCVTTVRASSLSVCQKIVFGLFLPKESRSQNVALDSRPISVGGYDAVARGARGGSAPDGPRDEDAAVVVRRRRHDARRRLRRRRRLQ